MTFRYAATDIDNKQPYADFLALECWFIADSFAITLTDGV